MSKINLYCFPFAGANKYSYTIFKQFVDPAINLIPLELPGRGARVKERFLATVEEMVDDLFLRMKEISDRPYAIYGHSMGSILGYLTARKIVELGLNPPRHLFFSGCHAPRFRQSGSPLSHELSDSEFLEKLRSYGGISDDILISREFIDYYLPIFRADFRAYETFVYHESKQLDIPITIFLGDDEKITNEDVNMWQLETTKPVLIRKFPGDHFFIFKNAKELFQVYNSVLTSTPEGQYTVD